MVAAVCGRSDHMKVKKPAPTAPAISQDHQGAPSFFLRATYCACCLLALASGRPASPLLGAAGMSGAGLSSTGRAADGSEGAAAGPLAGAAGPGAAGVAGDVAGAAGALGALPPGVVRAASAATLPVLGSKRDSMGASL